jgi:hypothetical protein
MTTSAGLVLALLSAFALNWGWLAQHSAAQALPPLSVRRPLRALRSLFTHRGWVVGFVTGLAGWAFYVAALTLAPLSLVQAVSAGGIGVLALLAHRRGDRLPGSQWVAVAVATVGLALLGASLAGGDTHGRVASLGALALWLVVSAGIATLAGTTGAWVAAGAGLGLAAGTLYAAGDVATKAATFGGRWLALVPIVLAAHGLAFVVLQLGFQRGRAIATVGSSTLATNALPIVGGIALFHERLPGGALGDARMLAFVCVVVAATLLARREPA